MSSLRRSTPSVLVLSALLALAVPAAAAPMQFFGFDAANGTANSEAAFADWSAFVGAFDLDNLDVLTGTAGLGGSLTSDLGNTFTVDGDDFISINTFGFPVMDGDNLRLTGNGSELGFTWDLATPSTAFGFFSRDNDGGIITVTYLDGTIQSVEFQGAPNGNDNLFWGIAGLGSPVASVSITSTDMDAGANNSFWDRFVYAPASAAPEPGTVALLAIGLAAGLGAKRRRSKTGR